ncbi:uncharacterized protein K441DRAFT_653872, partial [Cenococcum geophilum 1.58]|uniref:uncharacterized protein n=1 Tax=Cenococcum geophilum 1.58 TaxID=794803 RepID=UPI00359004DE
MAAAPKDRTRSSFCKALVAPRAPACIKSYGYGSSSKIVRDHLCKALVAPRAPACFKSSQDPIDISPNPSGT